MGAVRAAPRAASGRGSGAEAPPDRASAEVRKVRIDESAAGQRIDNFLLRVARGVPKSHVYRIIRSGEVRVNGGRIQAEHRLALGDEVRVPPLRTSLAPPPAPAALPPVLYEDEHLLVLAKPAGLAAHGGSGISHGLIERARAARPAQPMLELAHRLDRETSGVLMLAKTRKALLGLHAMQREGEIEKKYLALVIGDWTNDRQHARFALARRTSATGGERRVVVDEEDGQQAHTILGTRERFGAVSLVEAELRTGRTHQIRVHLAHLGFPIVGDDRYGDFDLNHRVARGDWREGAGPTDEEIADRVVPARLARMFLHAASIRFAHPVSGEQLHIEAPLPQDCEEVLVYLRAYPPMRPERKPPGALPAPAAAKARAPASAPPAASPRAPRRR